MRASGGGGRSSARRGRPAPYELRPRCAMRRPPCPRRVRAVGRSSAPAASPRRVVHAPAACETMPAMHPLLPDLGARARRIALRVRRRRCSPTRSSSAPRAPTPRGCARDGIRAGDRVARVGDPALGDDRRRWSGTRSPASRPSRSTRRSARASSRTCCATPRRALVLAADPAPFLARTPAGARDRARRPRRLRPRHAPAPGRPAARPLHLRHDRPAEGRRDHPPQRRLRPRRARRRVGLDGATTCSCTRCRSSTSTASSSGVFGSLRVGGHAGALAALHAGGGLRRDGRRAARCCSRSRPCTTGSPSTARRPRADAAPARARAAPRLRLGGAAGARERAAVPAVRAARRSSATASPRRSSSAPRATTGRARRARSGRRSPGSTLRLVDDAAPAARARARRARGGGGARADACSRAT